MQTEANKSNSIHWYELLTRAYQKAESIKSLAEVLEVPRLTARTWLKRPTSIPRNVTELIPKLEAYIEKPKISGPNKSTRQRMWQAMRCLQVFTIENIMATAKSGLSTTQKFVKTLGKAGYVINSDKKSFNNVWQLIKNTGPKAPQVGRNRDFVYDENINAYAWQKGEGRSGMNTPKDQVVQFCSVEKPCTFLNDRMEGVGFTGKGFVPILVVRTVNGRSVTRLFGVKYKQDRGDSGFTINHCPWCGKTPGLWGEERTRE